ncbi:Clp protease N-terminal domain-containing protein [Leifsonia aquatica]|uniref:Clp protease N-terminal domain-containing protein n=1 Tax=Leifsonia aquatica TaxID=144185 RepID=UPI003812BA7B
MFERFARTARTAVEDAKVEAGRRGDRSIGSEHLLLAILRDDGLAQLAGTTAEAARLAAERLDRTALEAIGFTLGEPVARRGAPSRPASRLTPGAKAVIRGSLMNAADEKARLITTRHLLIALLDRPQPDPVASLFVELHIDRSALRNRLTDPRQV